MTPSPSDQRIASRRPLAKLAAVLILLIVVGAFAYYVWPTPYRFDHLNMKGTVLPVRIDRFTGNTEILYPTGWRDVENPKALSDLPAEELGEVQASFAWNAYPSLGQLSLTANVFNGSDWIVRRIIVNVTALDAKGNPIFRDRQYVFDNPDGTGAPHTSCRFVHTAYTDSHDIARISATVVGAAGTPRKAR